MEGFPTRSVLLEKRDEQVVMREGFRFLDEKRLLLASEALAQLKRYSALGERVAELRRVAELHLRQAVLRHGLEGLQVHPATPLEGARLVTRERNVLGVRLLEVTPEGLTPVAPAPSLCHPSPEARLLRESLAALIAAQAAQAALEGNLRRLLAEYRKTELRARALEEVILPELERDIHEIAQRLEEMEQEDAVRVRQGALRHHG